MTIKKEASDSIGRAAEVLKRGGIAVLPTDTVYGLSAQVPSCANSPDSAEEKIRRIKGRSESKPFIQLIAQPDDIWKYTDERIPDALLSCWPGALTLVVPTKKTAPLFPLPPTVAFRCPGDEWLRAVIGMVGRTLYSTSVNKSGSPALWRIDDIVRTFGRDVDLIVSDGDRAEAIPSTVAQTHNGHVTVLRQGAVKLPAEICQ